MIGLCGAHRTGKTTLAKAVAERINVPFLQTSASGVFKELGFDPKKDYPMGIRLDIQQAILDSFAKQYKEATVASKSGVFVTDRTPLDMIAYTLADVQRENFDPAHADKLEGYVRDCFKVLNQYFGCVVLVQPGVPLVEAEGKAPAVKAYIEHLNFLVLGAMTSEYTGVPHFYIPRKKLDLEERVMAVQEAIERTVRRHDTFLKSRAEADDPVTFH